VMLGHGENSLFDAHAQIREQFPGVPLHIVVADIRDRARIERIFRQYEPDVVFHAAAHKHVHLMEEHFEEAISNNVVGTQNIVDAALATKTQRFVAISTDKAVSPSGIMGASKRMAGIIVRHAARESGRKFMVVRFGNVLGSRGSVVPFFKRQIERGGPVTITHRDMKRFFMTIPEAVHLVLEAGGLGNGGELFVLNMGKPVRIMDLAEDLIRLSGFTTDQIPITTTGVRPGEKLEEQLWETDAVAEPTAHPDILRVREPERSNGGDLRQAVEAMGLAAETSDRFGVEAVLCEWIPTFSPALPAESREIVSRSAVVGPTSTVSG
jgi:FlaA1/EpsC-like NDP-sugar epimerase